jgi:sulfhydrogenase subunit beta (sulfur reductase)
LVGSGAGFELLKDLPYRPATEGKITAAERVVARTRDQMGRTLETNGLKEFFQMSVRPAFALQIEDTTDLSGTTAERVRRWDSCFTLDFSYVHGGSVRSSARSRG